MMTLIKNNQVLCVAYGIGYYSFHRHRQFPRHSLLNYAAQYRLVVHRTDRGTKVAVEWRDRYVVTGDWGVFDYPPDVILDWARVVLGDKGVPS